MTYKRRIPETQQEHQYRISILPETELEEDRYKHLKDLKYKFKGLNGEKMELFPQHCVFLIYISVLHTAGTWCSIVVNYS